MTSGAATREIEVGGKGHSMRNVHRLAWLVAAPLVLAAVGCSKHDEGPSPSSDTWDIDRDGIPRFVSTDYIQLDRIHRISRFRSSVGHDYSDAVEHCQSMKHYYEPHAGTDWSTIQIRSPVAGTITRVEVEWAGTKLEIAARAYPAFRLSIFHIQLVQAFAVGDVVTEGQPLGRHVGTQTMSDISVIVSDPTRQGRMVSYFDVMTDPVFQAYQARGVIDRNALIISKAVRGANPLTCVGDTFDLTVPDPLEPWVVLD